MGNRQVNYTRTQRVKFCDLCDHEDSNYSSFKHCYICGRECCFKCKRWIKFGSERTAFIELFFDVCLDCFKIGESTGAISTLNDVIDTACGGSLEAIENWKTAVKAAD